MIYILLAALMGTIHIHGAQYIDLTSDQSSPEITTAVAEPLLHPDEYRTQLLYYTMRCPVNGTEFDALAERTHNIKQCVEQLLSLDQKAPEFKAARKEALHRMQSKDWLMALFANTRQDIAINEESGKARVLLFQTIMGLQSDTAQRILAECKKFSQTAAYDLPRYLQQYNTSEKTNIYQHMCQVLQLLDIYESIHSSAYDAWKNKFILAGLIQKKELTKNAITYGLSHREQIENYHADVTIIRTQYKKRLETIEQFMKLIGASTADAGSTIVMLANLDEAQVEVLSTFNREQRLAKASSSSHEHTQYTDVREPQPTAMQNYMFSMRLGTAQPVHNHTWVDAQYGDTRDAGHKHDLLAESSAPSKRHKQDTQQNS